MTNYLFIAIANAIICFILFRYFYLRNKMRWVRVALVMTALILTIPALLFSSNYILHIPDGIWFVSLHSLPGVEATSGMVGALLGVIYAFTRLRLQRLNIPVLVISTAVAAILLIVPFAKQLFFKLDYSELENNWMNGVCIQTSSTTCMPASCATVVRMLGGNLTERELAMEAGTNKRGTEIWYMMRVMRRHGYEIDVRAAESLKDVPVPSILGVMIGKAGHVVVLMSKTDTGPEIGDPLGSRKRYSWKDFEGKYQPKLTYFVIRSK